jgi:hypothetical protein
MERNGALAPWNPTQRAVLRASAILRASA